MDTKTLSEKILNETEKIIVGKRDVIELVIVAVFTGGHVLLNDLPGVGKTTLAKTISLALGTDYKRIQFVSDMLPSDIIGMKIFNQKSGDFELRKGPVMTNILLADEINRAIPRTQSSLLEAMEEHQISIDGETFLLPRPFIVLATENPVEKESTFHLPAAQMDRFLLSLSLGYPNKDDELRMLEVVGTNIPFSSVEAVSNAQMIIEAQEECKKVHTSNSVMDYIVKITQKTRNDSRLKMGISPRGTKALYQATKTYAAMKGRDFVIPDDVKALIHPVFDHRLVLESSAEYSGLNPTVVLDDILAKIPVPDYKSQK